MASARQARNDRTSRKEPHSIVVWESPKRRIRFGKAFYLVGGDLLRTAFTPASALIWANSFGPARPRAIGCEGPAVGDSLAGPADELLAHVLDHFRTQDWIKLGEQGSPTFFMSVVEFEMLVFLLVSDGIWKRNSR
ncbi:hypothetical protein [Bradyrhizobium valentinum]|uniref:hypothetical protein n=1 Tax=Bradyrhizobium valentinum TaxID=1518501 RepID=UPI0012E34F3C|nr:hypothetical protein [Bradyrhizobium valentinum]